jgi:hypothetical protein
MKNWSVGVMEYWSNEKETGGIAVAVLQYSNTPGLHFQGMSLQA